MFEFLERVHTEMHRASCGIIYYFSLPRPASVCDSTSTQDLHCYCLTDGNINNWPCPSPLLPPVTQYSRHFYGS